MGGEDGDEERPWACKHERVELGDDDVMIDEGMIQQYSTVQVIL